MKNYVEKVEFQLYDGKSIVWIRETDKSYTIMIYWHCKSYTPSIWKTKKRLPNISNTMYYANKVKEL